MNAKTVQNVVVTERKTIGREREKIKKYHLQITHTLVFLLDSNRFFGRPKAKTNYLQKP